MALPTELTLSVSRKDLPLHPELICAERYRDFVIYGVLACPATLNNHDVDALFKTVAQDALVIPIFRDFMLNIHVEVLLAPEAG